jgi:hypothetical protein
MQSQTLLRFTAIMRSKDCSDHLHSARFNMLRSDTGVVESTVQTPVGGRNLRDRFPHHVGTGDVASQGHGLAAGSIDRGDRLFGGLRCQIGDRTLAPSLANARAVARPMPPPPPVISADFPSSMPVIRMSSFRWVNRSFG